MRNMPSAEAERSVRLFLAGRQVSPETVERIAGLSRLLPPAGHYVAGLAGIAEQNRRGGGVNVFRGEVSVDGVPVLLPRGVRGEVLARLPRWRSSSPRASSWRGA